ncbi:MAG: P-loop NTPase [Campylobacterota bacterium]|nr:P-loop NTPase [Campylobacterota bacterium]
MFNHISTQANKLVSMTKRINSNSKTKVIAITSGKGGVGKSTIASNIAYLMSQKDLKVAILDADIGLSNLQVLFDIKPKNTFFDYFDGNATIDEILLSTGNKNVTLIAGQSGFQYTNKNTSMVFTTIVDEIVSLDRYDILLIDTGAGINEHVQEFLELTDNIIAITTTDPSALTDVYALIKMLSRKKNKMMLCFNHTSKYEIGETITKSITNLAVKNKLNRNFMVKYIGNVGDSKSISTTGRLRKLYTKEFMYEQAAVQLDTLVNNLIKELG